MMSDHKNKRIKNKPINLLCKVGKQKINSQNKSKA